MGSSFTFPPRPAAVQQRESENIGHTYIFTHIIRLVGNLLINNIINIVIKIKLCTNLKSLLKADYHRFTLLWDYKIQHNKFDECVCVSLIYVLACNLQKAPFSLSLFVCNYNMIIVIIFVKKSWRLEQIRLMHPF